MSAPARNVTAADPAGLAGPIEPAEAGDGPGSDASDAWYAQLAEAVAANPAMASVYRMLREGRGHEARNVARIVDAVCRTEAGKELGRTGYDDRHGPEVTELASAKADRWTLALTHAIFQAIERPELHA